MTTLQELIVPLKLDDTNFSGGLENSITKATAFGNILGNLATGAITGAFNLMATGLTKVNDFLTASVGSASNLSESINAVNVVFEDGAGIIQEYGKTAAETVGLSNKSFNELASVTGAFLTNLGYTSSEAATETIKLTERAADMASVFNTDVSDALEAINSGLKGEFNPLERFGVKINAAAIEAKALEMGLAKNTKELTDSAKAQAALALVMEQTDKVAGDFTNTSMGLANSQRIIAATFEDIKAKVGTALLPAIQALTLKFREFTTSPEFQEGLTFITDKLTDIGNWVINVGIPGFTRLAGKIQAAFKKGGWKEVFSTLDAELATAIDNIDWASLGTKFGEKLDALVGVSIDGIEWPKWTVALSQGIKEFFIAAIGGPEIWDVWKRFFSQEGLAVVQVWGKQLQDTVSVALSNMIQWITTKLVEAKNAFVRWATNDVPTAMNNWKNNLLTIARNTMSDLYINTSNKLTDIAKEFFNRGLGWANQLQKGFENGKGKLLGYLGGLVDEINGILKKIITSFKIDIKLPTWLSGSGNTNTSTGTSSSGGSPAKKRASGGPVIAGQTYNVAEFYQPERFIPNQSGRIDKLTSNDNQSVRIINWSDFDYSRLASEVVKAQNNI